MQCKWLQCIWKLDIMNGQSVTNNRICGGNVMSQAKIFKLLSEAYGLTWSGGIAAEVIDGCPVTLKEDRYYVQVSAYMPERVYEAKHEIFNEQMKAVKGVKCGFDKKTSRITTVLSQPNRVVEQYGALREIIKQYAAPYVEEDKCPYCGQGECDMAAIYNDQYRRVHVRCHQYHTDRTRGCCAVRSGQSGNGNYRCSRRCSALYGDCTWQSASLQKDLMVGSLFWQRSQR